MNRRARTVKKNKFLVFSKFFLNTKIHTYVHIYIKQRMYILIINNVPDKDSIIWTQTKEFHVL